VLLIAGELLYLVAGILHPERENANSHRAVFAEYASSAQWTAIHLGQFVGMAIIVALLLALFFALDIDTGTPALVSIWLLIMAWRMKEPTKATAG
jgi:hypothetical protein